jgi:pyruvate ferredoxin oxidoreductase alpha subunit
MTPPGDASPLVNGLLSVSRGAGALVHSAAAGVGERASSAAEAIQRAAAGEVARAAALLLPSEILGALGAIADAAAAHLPLVVHIPFEDGDDRAALAPLCESGAAIVATWTPYDAACAAIALHRAAQDSEMPFVQLYDAPTGDAPAPLLDRAAADALIGASPRRDAALAASADRSRVRSFAARVPFALGSALRDVGERAGRAVPLLERFETADADEVIVTYGRAFAIACGIAKTMRASGRKVGVLGVRALRPFLGADVVKSISRAKSAVVIEPFDVALAPTGPLAACVKGAFFDALTWAPGFPGVGRVPPVVSVTSAGAAITAADVEAALAELTNGERARRVVVLGSEG